MLAADSTSAQMGTWLGNGLPNRTVAGFRFMEERDAAQQVAHGGPWKNDR
jgi:hypothetical protein